MQFNFQFIDEHIKEYAVSAGCHLLVLDALLNQLALSKEKRNPARRKATTSSVNSKATTSADKELHNVATPNDDEDSSETVPDTKDPDTKGPDTKYPDTKDPDTEDPDTKFPDTEDPDTKDPDTKDPEPDTKDPDTKCPDTKDPEGKDPDTKDTLSKEFNLKFENVLLIGHPLGNATSIVCGYNPTIQNIILLKSLGHRWDFATAIWDDRLIIAGGRNRSIYLNTVSTVCYLASLLETVQGAGSSPFLHS